MQFRIIDFVQTFEAAIHVDSKLCSMLLLGQTTDFNQRKRDVYKYIDSAILLIRTFNHEAHFSAN